MKLSPRLLPVLTLAGSVLMAGALLRPEPVQSSEVYEINFGTAAPEGTPWASQLKGMKTRLETESGGRIKMRLFLSSTLGGEVEMVRDIVEGGRLQGGGFSSAAIAEGANVPMLQIPELPFLFRSNSEVDAVLDGVLYEPIKKKLKRRGLHLYCWGENGWRSFYTKKKAIRTIADLREHKMRVQESKAHKEMYKALEVQAEAISVPEVLDALTRGTVDGFDNTTLFGQASGWFEPTKYYTLSKHIYQPAALVYGRDFYDSLPEDLQTLLDSQRVEETARGREGVRGLEAELQANFSELGVEVVTPTAAEMAPFMAATAGVHDMMRDEVGAETLDAVKAKLAELRAGSK